MLLFEVLEFIGKIQRRQDREIHRADRVAACAKFLDSFIDCARHGLHPLVVTIAGDREVLAHDFDAYALHHTPAEIENAPDRIKYILSEVDAVEALEDFFYARLNLAA